MKQMETFTFITVILLLLILFPSVSHAQVPGEINYQGYLTDVDGNTLDGTCDMWFHIYNDPNDGDNLWNEEQSVLITNDVFNVNLGAVVPLSEGIFSAAYVGIEVEIYGSSD